MPTWLKMVAVLCCLMPWLRVAASAVRPSHTPAPLRPEMRGRGIAQSQSEDSLVLALLGVAELGAMILLVEAFMRKSDAPKAWPIAIAAMGLITFGAMSVVYFAIWGWRPTYPKVAWAEDFCQTCKANSLERASPGAGTHNLMGLAFLGHSAHCDLCGSSVRTLWLWLLLPVVPVGSYRILPVGKAQVHQSWFRSRKVALNIIQVATCYSFVAAIVMTFWWLATRES